MEVHHIFELASRSILSFAGQFFNFLTYNQKYKTIKKNELTTQYIYSCVVNFYFIRSIHITNSFCFKTEKEKDFFQSFFIFYLLNLESSLSPSSIMFLLFEILRHFLPFTQTTPIKYANFQMMITHSHHYECIKKTPSHNPIFLEMTFFGWIFPKFVNLTCSCRR